VSEANETTLCHPRAAAKPLVSEANETLGIHFVALKPMVPERKEDQNGILRKSNGALF
jgi:hypothetical protein